MYLDIIHQKNRKIIILGVAVGQKPPYGGKKMGVKNFFDPKLFFLKNDFKHVYNT